MSINPNIISVDTLAMSGIGYTSNFNISVSSSEYIEDVNGNRKFIIKGTAQINTSSITSERRFRERYTRNDANIIAQFMTTEGKIIKLVKGGNVQNNWRRTHPKSNPRPFPTNFTISTTGVENLPDDKMQVKLIVRADNSGASNVIIIEKELISNKPKENLKTQDQEITFNEQQNSGDFNDTPITEINLNNSCSECTGTKFIDPIPEKQLTESYLKIGGIAVVGVGILLLYTMRNK